MRPFVSYTKGKTFCGIYNFFSDSWLIFTNTWLNWFKFSAFGQMEVIWVSKSSRFWTTVFKDVMVQLRHYQSHRKQKNVSKNLKTDWSVNCRLSKFLQSSWCDWYVWKPLFKILNFPVLIVSIIFFSSFSVLYMQFNSWCKALRSRQKKNF